MAEKAIEVAHLCKSYNRGLFRQKKQVLKDVSFVVPKGCVFGFLGHNGAGKSTTIKTLLDFAKPDSGEVTVLGEHSSSKKARRNIGFLPETADYYAFLTPRKLLMLYGEIFSLSRQESRLRSERLLDLVGLGREKDEKISTFSKGMKQRVGIAQALLNEPKLLIFDEPANGLDPLGQREIRDLISDQKKAGRTIFFSSHELAEVEAVCDEAVIIRQGEIVKAGSLQELVPYRSELIAKVRGATPEQLQELPFFAEFPQQPIAGESQFIVKPGYSIQAVAQELSQRGIETISIGAVRDSLEEIFLQLMKQAK
jgi:ABC-2 type transport system ATP-binding protein